MRSSLEASVLRSGRFLVLLALGSRPSAGQQVTAADYARAERFMPWNSRRLVKNQSIDARWFTAERFWYRREIAGGQDFVVVDARANTSAPAFDHARLAQALSVAGAGSYTATSLPLEQLELA